MSRRYLYFAVFSSGLTTLAVELTTSRLLGSVFGTANLVWASIIGLMLIYLTLGYFIGGRWADRSPHYETFYRIMLWGAFTAGLVPLVARPVLRSAANAFDQLQIGVLGGAFISVLFLFIVPITLLGTISPFAIRLAIESTEDAGKLSGRIYAVSTLGSFIGTFLPVLILIPLIGTTYSFLVFSGYLLIVALIGYGLSISWRRAAVWLWMPIVLLIFGMLWGGGAFKNSEGQVYETESAYNYIQVLQFDEFTFLRLNDGQGIHSMYHPDQLIYDGPWMQYLAAPYFNPAPYDPSQVESIAIVGLAAGTTARQATAAYGPIPIDGYEIDPVILDVGREYFDMNMPNLNAEAVDGRWGLEHSERQYTIIGIDAYRPPYIPWHLTTQEFFQITYDRLTDDGVLVINVGNPNDPSLLNVLVSTLDTIYPSIYVMDIPGSLNSMVYATKQPTQFENIQENYTYLSNLDDVHSLITTSVGRIIVNRAETPQGDLVLTDDRAPVEWIVNNMVIRFVTGNGIEDLQ
ncbi:MAG: spermine synthase [Chloroflexi bacterium]|nr:MAG: spermine synthase [Chloroflexota bacterium]MBL1196560.1 spermine synthase [Chloroflexota bacterium]NOH13855.1 fused MFS/spermidine synthase [Chloroflexota bacterium]